MLSYVDKLLRQITAVNKPFRGLVVILFGDSGQLPPAGANSLWVNIWKKGNLPGFAFCN